MKQPTEADLDIEIRDADVEIIFKPMMSRYSFPLLRNAAKSLQELTFDMSRRAILVIMLRVISKLWHSVLPALRSSVSNTEFVTPKKTAHRTVRLIAALVLGACPRVCRKQRKVPITDAIGT